MNIHDALRVIEHKLRDTHFIVKGAVVADMAVFTLINLDYNLVTAASDLTLETALIKFAQEVSK